MAAFHHTKVQQLNSASPSTAQTPPQSTASLPSSIGKAIAKKFAEEGACVIINDINEERLQTAMEEFVKLFGKDTVSSVVLDVTNNETIEKALAATAIAFGCVDIVVNNAGISISKSIAEHSIADWDKLYDILVKGQFLVSKVAVEAMRKQGFGGDIVNIVSKNAIVAGPNNAGYGSKHNHFFKFFRNM